MPPKPFISPLIQGMQNTNRNISRINMPNQPKPLQDSLTQNFNQNQPLFQPQGNQPITQQGGGFGMNQGGISTGTGNEVMDYEGLHIDNPGGANLDPGIDFGIPMDVWTDPNTGRRLGYPGTGEEGIGGSSGGSSGGGGSGSNWSAETQDPLYDQALSWYDLVMGNTSGSDWNFEINTDWASQQETFNSPSDAENFITNYIWEYLQEQGGVQGGADLSWLINQMQNAGWISPQGQGGGEGTVWSEIAQPTSSSIGGVKSFGRKLSPQGEFKKGSGFTSSGEGISTLDSLLSRMQQGSKF